jgi:Fungal protein kinase
LAEQVLYEGVLSCSQQLSRTSTFRDQWSLNSNLFFVSQYMTDFLASHLHVTFCSPYIIMSKLKHRSKRPHPRYIGGGYIDASPWESLECNYSGYSVGIVRDTSPSTSEEEVDSRDTLPIDAEIKDVETSDLSSITDSASSTGSIDMDCHPISTMSSLVQRVASTQLPHINRALTVEALNHLLRNELMGCAFTDSQGLVDLVFPYSVLPRPIDRTFLADLEKYTYTSNSGSKRSRKHNIIKQGKWTDFPSLDPRHKPKDAPRRKPEDAFAKWLDLLSHAISTVCKNATLKRKWTGEFAHSAISDSMHHRKPDVLLVRTSQSLHPAVTLQWQDVCSLIELTSTSGSKRKILDTICNKAFICFTVQPNRRFLPALYIYKTTFRFCVFDRSGGVQSIAYNINADSTTFIRLIVGLCFAEDEVIGYDPSMTQDSTNSISAMRLNDVEYKAKKQLIATQSLRGRATHVWIAENPAKVSCIIKDCWIAAKRNQNEIAVLKEIKALRGVPKIIDGELVQFHGKDDSTGWLRQEFNFTDLRFHLRIAMSPIGIPLSKFKSKKELIGIFMDVLKSKIP